VLIFIIELTLHWINLKGYEIHPLRILRIELAAAYDKVVTTSGLDMFVNMTFKGEVYIHGYQRSLKNYVCWRGRK